MSTLGRTLGMGKLTKSSRGGEERWVLDWKAADGTRRRQALSLDRRVAERLRVQIISQRDLEMAGLASVEGQSRPLSELAELYLADLQGRVTPQSFRNAKDRLERMLKLVKVSRVRDLLPHMVMAARTRRVAEGTGHVSANTEVARLQAMLRWAVRSGLIKENPIEQVQRLPEGKQHVRHQRRALSAEEIERFLAAAAADDQDQKDRIAAKASIANGAKGPKWNARVRNAVRVPQAMLWMAFLETGSRYGELVRTSWADLDIQARTLTLRAETTKTGKQRAIPLRNGLVEGLAALRPIHERVVGRALHPTDRVFLTPDGVPFMKTTNGARRLLARVLEKAGIDRIDPRGRVIDIHSLRHSFATRLARADVGLLHAQRLLGHSSPQMTATIYTHLELDDLRTAIDRLDDPKNARAAR